MKTFIHVASLQHSCVLVQCTGSEDEDREGKKRKRKDSRKKKDDKDKKKKKKGLHAIGFCHVICMQCLWLHIEWCLALSGSSSSEDDSNDLTSSDVVLADGAAVFNLGRKDMARHTGSQTLQELSSRQLGYCLASILPQLTSTRVMELGGELEASAAITHNKNWQHAGTQTVIWHCCNCDSQLKASKESLHVDRAARARKTKDKHEEADSLFQATMFPPVRKS